MENELWESYAKKAMSFAAYGNNMHYPCYGLVEEAGELQSLTLSNDSVEKSRYIGECGDICWMLVAICHELNIDWSKIADDGVSLGLDPEWIIGEGLFDNTYKVSVCASKVAGKVAKFIRKHDGLDPKVAMGWVTKKQVSEAFNKDVSDIFTKIVAHIVTIGANAGFTFDEVLDYNIAKLTERKKTGTIKGSGETVAERLANAQKETLKEEQN